MESDEWRAEEQANTRSELDNLTKLMGGFVTSSQVHNEKSSKMHHQLANTVKVTLQESSGQAAIQFKEEIIETSIEAAPNDAAGEAAQTKGPIISEKERKAKARKDRKEKAMAEN